MISLSLHGIVAVSSTLHSKENSYWVDLEFTLTRGRVQELTFFFESFDTARRFHESLATEPELELSQ